MKYYYDDKFLVFKFDAKLLEKVILYNLHYKKHIQTKHSEMDIKIIEEVLEDPEFIFKPSRSSNVFYYEKDLGEDTYRVVVGKYERSIKKVITAYRVLDEKEYTIKHTYCLYDKKTFIHHDDVIKELENDMDYFYQVFNIEG